MNRNGALGIVVAVIVIIVIAVAVSSLSGSAGTAVASGKNGTVAVLLTDPPQVPAGTQSLVVSYSAVQVHVNTEHSGQPNPAWINASGSGSLNLMSIVNLSQTIAAASISNGSTIDMVRFNVSGAVITINGTAYNVTIPSGRITAHVSENPMVNGTTGLLLQMNPTVASIFTSNSTVFVLVPSVRAIVVGSGVHVQVGARANLSREDSARLNESGANISITGLSLGVSGNTTTLSVTVRDNSNQSVLIKHMTIFGNLSASVSTPAVTNTTNSVVSRLLARLKNESVCSNASGIGTLHIRGGDNGTVEVVNSSSNSSVQTELPVQDRPDFANFSGGIGANVSANASSGQEGEGSNSTGGQNANATASEHANATEMSNESTFHAHEFGDFNARLNSSVCSSAALQAIADRVQSGGEDFGEQISHLQEHFRMLPMAVTSGGGLIIASGEDGFDNSSVGYSLAAGQSVTLNFTGELAAAQGHMLITPQAGRNYTIGVGGEDGAMARANVTAMVG
ncbi:MAG: DUF4382 domain-containing protein [Candidatus Micrarchaeota archaeon]|nr:DUF4382 domain-containing protein [Candidatus Micrarchaeota archaeon]